MNYNHHEFKSPGKKKGISAIKAENWVKDIWFDALCLLLMISFISLITWLIDEIVIRSFDLPLLSHFVIGLVMTVGFIIIGKILKEG